MLKILGTLTLLALLSTPAMAMQQCTVGASVKLPGGKIATVVSIDGTACTVTGKDQYGNTLDGVWSAFMLDPAEDGAITSVDDHTLNEGRYQCWANGNYLFVDIIIATDGVYRDGSGKSGRFSLDTDGSIAFAGGPFADYSGEALDGFVYLQQPDTQSRIQCRR